MLHLHLQQLTFLVLHSNIHLRHTRAQLAKDSRGENVQFVWSLVGGNVNIEHIGTILIYLGFCIPLVEENILVLFVKEEFQVTCSLVEWSKDPVLTNHCFVENGFRIQFQFTLKPNLEHGSIVYL